MEHISVLKDDVEKYLGLTAGNSAVDATLGLGGHAKMILEAIGEEGRLYAFEQDERNLIEAKKRLKEYDKQTIYFKDNFRYLKKRITELGVKEVDAILFDLGLSSPHVDEPERGFSFMEDGPLDMRFDQSSSLTAADVLNTYEESELADIFFHYGEERLSRKIARRVCEYRKAEKFFSTVQLAKFLEKILPRPNLKKGKKRHPATKIFQALRIEVNDEMTVLKEALEQAVEILRVGGRIVVISYHSVEDRVVKQFFKSLLTPKASPEEMLYRTHGEPLVESLTKKPVVPSPEEVEKNPRSRSAKLRAYKLLIPIK